MTRKHLFGITTELKETKMTPNVEIGGKIVFMEEPVDTNHHQTHAVPFRFQEKIVCALENIDGARRLRGR